MLDSRRVALDVAPVRASPTGVGIYVRELALALAGSSDVPMAYIGLRDPGPLDGEDALRPATRLIGGSYIQWLERHSEGDARHLGAALVHYTSGMSPLRSSVPFVVTIHDLTVLRDPLHHPPPRVARALWLALAARRARAIIVPSHAVKRDLVRAFRTPADRVVVVNHAVVRPLTPGESPGDAAVRARYGVGDVPYVLTTGGLDPRKNPQRLAEAVAELRAERPELRLVIAGGSGWRGRLIERAFRRAGVADRVVVAGYVPDDDLRALMRGATVFAYVSLHEGFGLPILEAMSGAIPVVTSRRSSMPEAAGGAAVLVDPRRVDDIVRGLREAIARRDELGRAGVSRVASRSWADVAAETIAVYRRALAERPVAR
jgi:alpha-1,3-rhamnosyl/mannosyltransferase